MSESLWKSQLEINELIDKRFDLSETQLTKLTDLVIEQGKLLQQLTLFTKPVEPELCTGKHCKCGN